MSIVTNNAHALAIRRAQRNPNTSVSDLVRLYGLSQGEAIRVLSDVGRG